jgi:putative transposase
MAKTQTLSFPVRLPDAMQVDALRLLDASREAVNALLSQLWDHLDDFVAERTGPAWKLGGAVRGAALWAWEPAGTL